MAEYSNGDGLGSFGVDINLLIELAVKRQVYLLIDFDALVGNF